MATTLNAGTTTATSLSITTDTSGAMAIQTNGTTAISISSAQAVTLTNPLPAGSGGTGITSLGTGVATFLGTPSSANLAAAVTDETGTGSLVFSASPTFTGTPIAPTAAAGTNTTQIATTAFVNSAIAASPIPAGSVMLFYQAAAPTGWTQVTTLNDYDLRLVSGTGGSTGGTTAYSTVFANQTPAISNGTLAVGATTLSLAQIASHAHGYSTFAAQTNINPNCGYLPVDSGTSGASTDSQGGGGSHTHSISGSATSSAITLNVRYANIIICSKN